MEDDASLYWRIDDSIGRSAPAAPAADDSESSDDSSCDSGDSEEPASSSFGCSTGSGGGQRIANAAARKSIREMQAEIDSLVGQVVTRGLVVQLPEAPEESGSVYNGHNGTGQKFTRLRGNSKSVRKRLRSMHLRLLQQRLEVLQSALGSDRETKLSAPLTLLYTAPCVEWERVDWDGLEDQNRVERRRLLLCKRIEECARARKHGDGSGGFLRPHEWNGFLCAVRRATGASFYEAYRGQWAVWAAQDAEITCSGVQPSDTAHAPSACRSTFAMVPSAAPPSLWKRLHFDHSIGLDLVMHAWKTAHTRAKSLTTGRATAAGAYPFSRDLANAL